jgi:Mannosyltransferase (PIG-V)
MPAMRWREALVAIAALFLVSRGALVLVAWFLENNIPLAYHGPTYASGPLLSSLTGTDSLYLLGIAAEGYHGAPVHDAFRDWAFFPLYPVATRVVSLLTLGNVAVAGLLVANVSFIAALAVLYALTIRHLDHERSVRSLAFVTFAPGAVAFAMAYSDSLFLLLAAAAFLAAEQRRWWLMAVLYGLASLTRLQGVLLGIPLAILIAESSGGWRTSAGWRSSRLLFLAAGPIGFGLFAAYLGWAFGDPLGMFTAQQAWSNIGRPETGNTTPVLPNTDAIVLLLVGVLVLYLLLFLFRRPDRLPASYTALALVTVITALASGRLQSIGRYLAVAWPFDWLLANRRAAWFELTGLAAFAALFVVHAMLHFTQALAP